MDKKTIEQVRANLIALRKHLMRSPPRGASKEKVLSHFATLVGDARTGIDSAVAKLTFH